MAIKWIITDIDGCLTPEASVPWELGAMWEFAMLCREHAAGSSKPMISLCTGRPQPYVEALLKLFDMRAPAICENGAVIYSLDDNSARYGPGVTEERILALRKVRALIETDLLPRFPGALIQFGKEAQLSVFAETPEIFASMQPLIEAHISSNGGPRLDIKASQFYLNISLHGVDKGRAATELARELGVSREEMAGIGDTEGDLPLREACGFFACPSNAREAVRTAADYVSPHDEVRGVMDIIKVVQRLG